jgi:hypothetical protein
MKKEKKIQFNIYLTPSMVSKLQKIKKDKGTPIAETVRRILEKGLKNS